MIRLERKFFIILCLISLAAFIFSCGGNSGENENDSGFFDFSSDTEKAVKLIDEANNELRRIKILYNETQASLQELKEANQNRDSEKVKFISRNLVDVINDGFVIADSAKFKISEAQKLNIHQDYKDYLSLKEQSMEQRIEAFQFLYDSAKLLSDTAGSQDKLQMENARFVFKEKEENFQAKMEEARKISEQADNLAKESINRAK